MIKLPLGINEIKQLLPHRSPFLLIDKVVELIPYEKCIAYKSVSYNEWFFQGHFPEYPVMPGVLIIEAMAQSAGILACASLDNSKNPTSMLFASISNVRFRKQVVPGDLLRFDILVDNHRAKIWKFTANAFIDNTLVAEAGFTAMMP